MKYRVDLIRDIVLLIGPDYQVVDAFMAEGITEHDCEAQVAFYTYRSLLTLPGHCLVCGKPVMQKHEHCSASGGYHAFVGVSPDLDLAPQHRAENRSAPFLEIHFEDLAFFLEADQLFPISDISPSLAV